MAARWATSAEIVGSAGAAPELATYAAANPGTVTYAIALGQRFIGLSAWGEDASFGHAQIVAHFLTQASAGSAGSDAAVTSESDGPASRSFAVIAPTADDAAFAGTSYGRRFAEMRAAVIATAGPVLARGAYSAGFWGARW